MASMRAARGRLEWTSSGGTAVVVHDPMDNAAQANLDWPIGGTAPDVWQGGGIGAPILLNVDSAENGPQRWEAPRSFAGLTPGMVYEALFDTAISGIGETPQEVGVILGGEAEVTASFAPAVDGVLAGVLQPQVTAPASGLVTATLFLDALNIGGGYFLTWEAQDFILREAGVGPATARGLDFGYPLDFVVSAPQLRPNGRRATQWTGVEVGLRGAVEHLLRGDVRWVPDEPGLTREGYPVSGWWGDDGWEGFWRHAWSGAPFTFYPDYAGAPAVSYTCTLERPVPLGGAAAPLFELEPDGTHRIALGLRTLAGPFLGY